MANVDSGCDKPIIDRIHRATAVEQLFPEGVVAFELRGSASPEDLFPSERECVAAAVERRVREFAAGRLCARAGLVALGLGPAPLLTGCDRAPLWPMNISGSISHTENYCVAVVGREAQFAAIGVDVERIAEVSPALWPLTMRGEELSRLLNREESTRQQTAALIYSAKEAFYKCQYSLTRKWLGFEDVLVSVAGDAFEVSVIAPSHPLHYMLSPWVGRFRVQGDFIVTGIAAEHCNTRGIHRAPSAGGEDLPAAPFEPLHRLRG